MDNQFQTAVRQNDFRTFVQLAARRGVPPEACSLGAEARKEHRNQLSVLFGFSLKFPVKINLDGSKRRFVVLENRAAGLRVDCGHAHHKSSHVRSCATRLTVVALISAAMNPQAQTPHERAFLLLQWRSHTNTK